MVRSRRGPPDRPPRTGPWPPSGRAGPSGPGRCWSWPSRPRPRCGPAGSASRRRPGSAWSPRCRGSGRLLHLDTAITLPVGVEAYAAYALRAWLAREQAISDRTRRFAKWSAIFSFALGMAGQVAYHLMAQAGMARAPWADHHRGVLPAGPGPGHGDRAGPHAPRRRRHPGYAGRPGRPVSHPAVLDPASPDRPRTTSGRTLAQTGPLGGTRRDLPQDRRTHRSPGRSCGRCSHRPIRLVPSLVSWLPQDGSSHGGCCAGPASGAPTTP